MLAVPALATAGASAQTKVDRKVATTSRPSERVTGAVLLVPYCWLHPCSRVREFYSLFGGFSTLFGCLRSGSATEVNVERLAFSSTWGQYSPFAGWRPCWSVRVTFTRLDRGSVRSSG